ncbi:hypothetical protein PVK64_11825 [Aliivibrio sp. S4TY2]|uniref:hypothetical protein n=1 Tax=unclassified Aliivibrio TaxID=2645654 RepID=UPI002378B7CF|nr:MULTISPECIES: hypothetical protein [unclassified Aliivibrio]MDD9156863.1 hypothetical protein [Aliivibrio sp. S4TY2]MDD9160923.1 hypothetical protein [Aliivibrio sp. S4TY1]MDD9164953.1 hypothetical protein [Aliivibrio sp. S4MY2]MDD9168772.1 hypothetical protein [Aliivibrio sp. S4MY4]MDD9185301.1 hypothetical protein [Aliivibrio sp. S4MY3]
MDKVTLDDNLFIEYFRFKNGKSEDHDLIYKLLSNLKMPFVKAPCQAFRCFQKLNTEENDEYNLHDLFSPALMSSFLSGGYPQKTIEELAKDSKYKLILTADSSKDSYPYLNINNPNIELNYSKTCQASVDRADLIEHLKSLCENADKVTICDSFFFSDWNVQGALTTEKLFDDILPKKILTIEFVGYGTKTRQRKPYIEGKHVEWTMEGYQGERYSLNSNHDRYFIIHKPNSTIEVILSSGFIYLWKNTKEITCVLRAI